MFTKLHPLEFFLNIRRKKLIFFWGGGFTKEFVSSSENFGCINTNGDALLKKNRNKVFIFRLFFWKGGGGFKVDLESSLRIL